MKNRIEICQRLIKHHEEKIVHWGLPWLQRNRPDNIPEKSRRETFKRDSRVKIEKAKARLSGYRKRLRDFGSDPRDQREVKTIVKRTATLSDYDFPSEIVKSRTMVGYVRGELRKPKDGVPYYTKVESWERVMEPGRYDVERYRALQNLGVEALFIQQYTPTSRSGWAKWENAVIEKAVQFSLVKLTDTARILAPRLGTLETESTDIDHPEEIALMKKTGGGGLTVYGRGWRWRPGRITKTGRTVGGTFRPRALENFSTEFSGNFAERGGDDAPGIQHDLDSGDWSPEEN